MSVFEEVPGSPIAGGGQEEALGPNQEALREMQELRWKKIMEDPLDPVLLTELLFDPRCKFSKIGRRVLERQIRRGFSTQCKKANTGKRKFAIRRRKARQQKKDWRISPEGYLESWKWRVEVNKRKTPSAILEMSLDEITKVFFETKVKCPVLNREVPIAQVPHRVYRIDKCKGFSMDNIVVVGIWDRSVKKRVRSYPRNVGWKGKVLWPIGYEVESMHKLIFNHDRDALKARAMGPRSSRAKS